MGWIDCFNLLSEIEGSVTHELFKPEISDALQLKREKFDF